MLRRSSHPNLYSEWGHGYGPPPSPVVCHRHHPTGQKTCSAPAPPYSPSPPFPLTDKAVVGPGIPPIGVLYQGSGNASCGSCYGAEANLGDCCNTCDEVREAYRRKGWALVDPLNVAQCAQDHHLTELRAQEGEGCRFHGKFKVNKVAGNFHFAPGKSFQQGYMHLHDLSPFRADQFFDFTHKVDKVAFGAEFPGMINPLDGITRDHLQVAVQGMWQYYLKASLKTLLPVSVSDPLGSCSAAQNE